MTVFILAVFNDMNEKLGGGGTSIFTKEYFFAHKSTLFLLSKKKKKSETSGFIYKPGRSLAYEFGIADKSATFKFWVKICSFDTEKIFHFQKLHDFIPHRKSTYN